MGTSSYSVFDQFARAADTYPERPALVFLGEKYTYLELREASERLAASLHQLGVGKGDRVVLYLPNCPQWVMAWLALLRTGSVAVPISPAYTPADLRYMANDSGAETVFCLDTNFGYVSQVLPETELRRVVVTNVADLLPGWKRLVGRCFDRIPRGDVARGEGIFRFRRLLGKARGPSAPSSATESEDVFEILYTGGTTGLPRGVPYSNVVFRESVTEQRAMSEEYIPRGEDTVIQGGPLFHILGQAVGLGALLSGDTLVLLPRMNLDGLLDCVERCQASTLFGVPAMFRLILEHERVHHYDLSSLKYCFCAGDVLPVEVAGRWLREFGLPLSQGYGTTETCGRVSLTPMGGPAPAGSAGRVTPLQKTKLVDSVTLRATPPGEPGELLVSSEHMVRSCWNKPQETAKCFIDMDGRLWYRTGDIVSIDGNGWLYYLDRSADTIKHKGHRVAASEVEATLQEHRAVTASCVVGIPDEEVGERIKAFVVLRRDVKGVSAYDLIRWCRERLGSGKTPQYIEFRDMLPKSKVGKLLRRELRAEERRKSEGAGPDSSERG